MLLCTCKNKCVLNHVLFNNNCILAVNVLVLLLDCTFSLLAYSKIIVIIGASLFVF